MKPFFYFILLSILILSACDSNKSEPTDSNSTSNILTGHLDTAQSLVSSCVTCHGKNGDASLDGAPFLAGQHEDYLATAMNEYVTGVRKHAPMKSILGSLSDQDRQDIAAYFSSKKSLWKAATIKRSNQVDPKKIIEDLGKRGKIVPCASCHGQDGNSPTPGVPSLSTLEPEYIEIALNGYLNGQRIDPFMTTFKLALSGVDIKSLAQYFSGHQARKTDLPGKGNAAAGERASKVCIGCHGINGNSLVPSIPSLAGQNADYLASAMKTYKTGARKNKMMRDVMHKMSDKTMQNIAAYYARQTPNKRRAGTEIKAGFSPLSDGKNIAMVCNGCHGENGNSTQADIPSLTRLHPEYLKSAIKNYRNGKRQHEIMSTLVAYLSDVEIEKVGLYYATLPPEISKHRGNGSETEARKIVAQCNNCHGNNGSSDKAKIPTLAGQSANYLTNAINAYKSGTRKHEDMQNAVKALSVDDIRNITTYYAVQTPKPQEERTLLSPQQLSKKCDHCHGENGYSTNPAVPRLAGQVPAYIEHALLDYQNGQRTHSTMNIMSGVLSLVEINAIAEHYFQQGKDR